MTIKLNEFSIYQLAREWKVNRTVIMRLIIKGDLKVSILHEDGTYVPYDKFSDIPDDLRECLKVIRPNRDSKAIVYKNKLKAWDQVYITREEIERYAADNSERNLPIEPAKESTRTIENLQNILVALAIDAYGYIPNAKKNTAVKDILSALDNVKVSVCENTIREYLKKGSLGVEYDSNEIKS